MQADKRDRMGASGDRRGQGSQTLVLVAAAVILAIVAYVLIPGDDPEPAVEAPEESVVERIVATPPRPDPAANIQAAEDIPEREPAPEPEPEPQPELEPPPPPPTQEEIDAQLREALVEAGAGDQVALAASLAAPFILDRGVSAADQVARGYVPLRALNLPRPTGSFDVRREGQQHYVDARSYDRYNPLVDALTAVSPAVLADSFHDLRPLLEEAYGALGYPADQVDNALVAALDAILAAPLIREPIAVESKGALWAYTDPALEQRSDLEKQLLRLGPDNLETLQRWARDLRGALLQ